MTSPIDPADDELQFHTAEPATTQNNGGPAACAKCGRPLTPTYFAVGKHPICANCRDQLEPTPPGNKFTRLVKAGLLGLGAGLIGAVLWYAVRRITNMEIGLVAVLVGFLVGKAVRLGSGNRGGLGYQIMAVILTYCCIAANYMPDIAKALIEKAHHDNALAQALPATLPATGVAASAATAPAGIVPTTTAPATTVAVKPKPGLLKLAFLILILAAVVFAVALAAPVLMGVSNVLGLLIICFALWEAWKFNRRVALPITGPYQLGSGPGSAGGFV